MTGKKWPVLISLLALVLAALGCAGTPPPTGVAPMVIPPGTPARVVYVVDGDTIDVEIGGQEYRVRYIGIDAPETVKPKTPVEWMGPEASAANKALVAGKIVFLEKDVSNVDKYGRLLRYVYLADGTCVNGELVRQGYAQAITYPPDVKHQGRLRVLEREARQASLGLWGPEPTPSP
jgi:micrococcal nuclease